MTSSPSNAFVDGRRNVLLLYNHHEMAAKAMIDYLESFYRYSQHRYAYVSSFSKCHFDLDYFDAVCVHYSVRMFEPGFLSDSYTDALRRYGGLKALFIQDEYDHTNASVARIRDLGIHLVFTCVPEEFIAKVYPPTALPGVKFVNVLTGYVPLRLRGPKQSLPMARRPILIGYRGRRLGYWYGDLGQEKLHIGVRMKQICAERGLTADIAWEERDRIYGDAWFDFLGRCKATLGSESGCNVFDFDGSLAATIREELNNNPNATYEEIRLKFLQGRETEIKINQISPKIFEAISCRTALVLFEGRYSDVVVPHRHFLPLKKDFSNVEEVLAKLGDDTFLEAMTERAYADVIGSGRYSFEAFVQRVDGALEENCQTQARSAPAWLPLPPCDALPAFRETYGKNFQPPALKRAWQTMPAFVRTLINRQHLRRLWSLAPVSVRAACGPLIQWLRSLLKPAH